MEGEGRDEGSVPGMPGWSRRLLRPDYWFFAPPKRGWRRVVVRGSAVAVLALMIASWVASVR